MACVLPPELNNQELLAYIDGEANRQVTSHIDQCPHCRERAGRLARWQGHLTARLYRLTCPTPAELGEYHLGMLAPDRATAAAQHLAECPHCSREVAQLKDYLAGLAPALEPSLVEQVKERARVVIARLVSGPGTGSSLFGGPALAPAYAGLRGEEDGPYLYEAEEFQVAIEVQDDNKQPGRKTILGLTTGPAPSGGVALLWQAQRRVASVLVDELGSFFIPDLAPGNYELILSGPAIEIHIQELPIGLH